MKILMVCLGNICRSPLAEGILKNKVKQHKLDWQVDSAGTGAYHVGQQPDPRSQAVAKKYGLDISIQRARQFRASDFDEFDLVFAMDRSNQGNILALATTQEQREKVHLILEFTGAADHNVPDPYWDDNGFEQVYQMLDQACSLLPGIVEERVSH
ncbi:low molecular weight protein-tyrosine-phosphatase [Lewinella cohaerens]|uniref:low molecular weight protein-tyrosine-phosphatase n=1 Tax=Lewinella cohaerens TaxID=70995 RepID=UPI000362E677|nr:low molecular weight protein-tyrosine-phosphatase [Lewinella cohaerens]